MARRGHFGLKTAFLNLSIGDMTIMTMTKKTTKKTSTTKTTIKGLQRKRLIGSAVAGFNHARTITKAPAMV